jgi:hypothetical protein
MAYIGKQPVVGNFVKLDAITTSATATYNLLNGGVAYFPQTANNCIVSLNGVIQSPTSAYTISGSTIVFSDALTASDSIDFILVLGDVLSIGTPSDSTVGFAKVTSNLITGATAETSIAGGDSVLIYDDSASALRKMTRTNFVSGIGGTNTPAFEACTNADQSVTSAVSTKIQFGREIYDTASCYDNTTNYRFTPTTAGKYFVYLSLYGGVAGVSRLSQFSITLKKNGSSVADTAFDNRSAALGLDMNIFFGTIIDFNGSTDYVEGFGYINDTSSANVTFYGSATVSRCRFGAYRIIE